MDKSKQRETRNKSVKKIDHTLSQGKNKKDSIDMKIPKKASHTSLILNIGNPVSHYGTEKIQENNTPKKPSFTPTNYKELNLSYKTNLESRLNTNQPITDEYKHIHENTNSKITGSMKIIDDIKKRIEEMKSEENKYKVYDKNLDGNVDKLIKNLKNELFDISKNIKTSEEKMENFFKTCSKTPIRNDKVEQISVKTKHDEQGFNHVLSDLKNKNDELLSELNVLRENFNDVKKQNSELKDKIVTNEKTSKHSFNLTNQGSEMKFSKPSINLDNLNTKNENFLMKNMSEKV
jgi:chromosome segregation ATPase